MSIRSLCRYGPNGPPTAGPSSQSRPSQRSVSWAEPMYSGVTRVRSVSSIRSTNVPPVERANAQSYRAVRTLPTCRSPLGEGANRTLTSVTAGHRVGEGPDVLDGHRYLVSVLERAGSRGGPGEQHVAGEQRHHATGISDQRRRVVQQLRRPGPLADLAVDRGDQLQVGGVGVGLDPRPQRAERVEAFCPRPLAVPLLQVARGDIVGAGIAEDHAGRLARRHVAAQPADDEGELALEVDALAHRDRVLDGVTGPADGGRGLQEQNGLRGGLPAHLAGVVGIIPAYRDHLAGQDRRQQPDIVERKAGAGQPDGVRPGAERVAAERGDDLPARCRGGAGRAVTPGLAHHSIADLVADGESGDAHVCPYPPGRRAGRASAIPIVSRARLEPTETGSRLRIPAPRPPLLQVA